MNIEDDTSNEQFKPQGTQSPINQNHHNGKDSNPKQGVKDNIMKMIRKRLNEQKSDQKRSKGSKYVSNDKMNVYNGERLYIPINHPG